MLTVMDTWVYYGCTWVCMGVHMYSRCCCICCILLHSVSSNSTLVVTKRDRPSNIGFSVLRIEIAKDGSLVPQAKIGVSYDHKVYITSLVTSSVHVYTTHFDVNVILYFK